MDKVSTIGLDIAKSVFQVHGVSEAGDVVVRRRLRRSELVRFFARLRACLIGIEACHSSHYWARELIALGHDVRLIPTQYVRPFRRGGTSVQQPVRTADGGPSEGRDQAIRILHHRQGREVMRRRPHPHARSHAAARDR